MAERISIMGATGSIGLSAADVIADANALAPAGEPVFEVDTLCAGRQVEELIALALPQ